MSYDKKIAQAKEVIETHNSNVSEDKQIKFDDFLAKLQELGGTSDDALKAVSWEDLKECGLPQIMARRMSHVFRTDENGDSGKSGWISEKKAHQLSVPELLERYDPRDDGNHVAKRLKSMSKGQKCIVFNSDGSVNVKASRKLLDDIRDGLPELSISVVEGDPCPVYAVGERPDQFWNENPLYPGRPLRSGDVCDQTNRSWEGVPLKVRQLIRLGLENDEFRVDTVADANDVLDRVMSSSEFSTWASRCPRSAVEFKELEQTQSLPTLRIKVGQGAGKSNDPFGNNTTY